MLTDVVREAGLIVPPGKQLKPAVIAGLGELWSYDLKNIRARVLAGGQVDPLKIEQAEREFRRFMTLALLEGGSLGMSSPEVDEVWHSFILFTKDYTQFCETVFGKYVHHMPVIKGMAIDQQAGNNFIDGYTRWFGELDSIWGSAADCNKCQESCATCNIGGNCFTID